MIKVRIIQVVLAICFYLSTALMQFPLALGAENTDKLITEAKKEGTVVINRVMCREGVSNAMRAQLIVAGEADLDINTTFSEVEQLKNKGAPIDWFVAGPTPAILSGYGVAAQANHPNAARMFLDFALSREGQRIFKDAGRPGVRSDLLQEQGPYKNIQIVPLDPSLGDKLVDEAKLMRSIFKKR